MRNFTGNMIHAAQEVEDVFKSYSNAAIESIERLPQSGGNRIYFRIGTADGTYIATFSDNVKENEAFFYFTDHFKQAGAPVPEIFAVNKKRTAYLQEDLGGLSLLDHLHAEGCSQNVKALYKKTLRALAQMQIAGSRDINYAKGLSPQGFGRRAILDDLLYFKYYFLDPLKIDYDKQQAAADFERLADYLSAADHSHFMFRDFQSRNVIIKNGEPFFIDYQGGMPGALQYDVASLLWQAKAALPEDFKNELYNHYLDCAEAALGAPLHRDNFTLQYNGFVLIRLLQVLGAYGFRGLFERKSHFLSSIPPALENLKWFLQHRRSGADIPTLEKVFASITTDEVIARFEFPHATADSALTVSIKSFSFLKTGYPAAIAENGGGFVFDCRGILNPGRVEEHRQQTGRDKPVQDFLAGKTRMDEFLNGVFSVVDIAVENYLQRNFESLEINFGCTGGQHRSVYAADATALHLQNKYGVRAEVKHLEQNFSS